MGLPLADAVAAYTASVDALLAADVDTPTLRELVTLFEGHRDRVAAGPDGRLHDPEPVGARRRYPSTRGHLDNLHHPERLLAPQDDDPF